MTENMEKKAISEEVLFRTWASFLNVIEQDFEFIVLRSGWFECAKQESPVSYDVWVNSTKPDEWEAWVDDATWPLSKDEIDQLFELAYKSRYLRAVMEPARLN